MFPNSNGPRRPRGYSPPFRPDQRRNHPTINPRNFSHDIVRQVQEKCFRERHLADILVMVAESTPTEIRNRLTRQQVETLRAPLPNFSRGIDRRIIEPHLRAWFDIFNSLFYGGALAALRDHVHLDRSIPGTDRPENLMDPTKKGVFRNPRSGRSLQEGYIRINLDMEMVGTGSVESEYVSTLVHEMLHAFLSCYRCECGACQAVRHPSLGGSGQGSHGPAWADPMLAIAQALQDQVTWGVEVGIDVGVDNETRTSRWQPLQENLVRWGHPDVPGVGGIMRQGVSQQRQYQEPKPQRRASLDRPGNEVRPWEGINRRREAREAQECIARQPWQPVRLPSLRDDDFWREVRRQRLAEEAGDRGRPGARSLDRRPSRNLPRRNSLLRVRPSDRIPSRYPSGPPRRRSPSTRRWFSLQEHQPGEEEPRGQSDIEAAIPASVQDIQDEELAQALAASRMDDESRRGSGSDRGGGGNRPRPEDPNEAATCILIGQLQAENQRPVADEEAANEEMIRRMIEEDAGGFEDWG